MRVRAAVSRLVHHRSARLAGRARGGSLVIEAAGNGNSRSHLTQLAEAGRVTEGGGGGADGSDSVGLEVAAPQGWTFL